MVIPDISYYSAKIISNTFNTITITHNWITESSIFYPTPGMNFFIVDNCYRHMWANHERSSMIKENIEIRVSTTI